MLKKPLSEIHYKGEDHSFIIRPFTEKDALSLHQAIHETLPNLLPFMNWAHEDLSLESQRRHIRICRDHYFQGTQYSFGIFDSASGEFLMSACWYLGRTRNPQSLEIGYWTRAKYSKKGLATLVTRILTIVGFEFMGCDRIEIICNKANDISHRVIEKCGFKFEAEIRNALPHPSQEMLKKGFTSERNCFQHSLITDDLPQLHWYQDIHAKITIHK